MNKGLSPCCNSGFYTLDSDDVSYNILECVKCEKEFLLPLEVVEDWNNLSEVKR